MMVSTLSRWSTRIAVIAVLMVPGVVHGAAEAPRDPFKDEVITREQRVLGLATIHANAKQHFPYFDQLPKLDWDKAFMEYLPQVEKKQSLYDYYRVLQRFTALLEDGHTGVSFPPSIEKEVDRLPIRVYVVEGKWIITGRSPTEEVLKEDIPPGSDLLSIEGTPPDKYFAEKFYPYIPEVSEHAKLEALVSDVIYRKDTNVRLALRYPDGSYHDRVIKANRSTMLKQPAEVCAKYIPAWRYGPGFSSSEPEPGILYIAFRSCDDESEKKAVDLIRSRKDNWPKGLILDLRANPGGQTPLDLFRHLISAPAKWDDSCTRWSLSYMDAQTGGSKAAAARWLKQHDLPKRFEPGWYKMGSFSGDIAPADVHYDGPLVILTRPATASAAEHLVVLLQQAHRGTVMGERTIGSAGQPVMFDLPGGGRGRVIATRSRYVDGREFTDIGCEPDILVKPTIRGITEGRDEVLDAALSYIRNAAK